MADALIFFSFPYSYICFKNKLDIPIFVTGILAGLVSITGKLAMIGTMRLSTFFCLFYVLSVYFSVLYCLSFIVTGLVENHPWVMVTTRINILIISRIIIVAYLFNNSSL